MKRFAAAVAIVGLVAVPSGLAASGTIKAGYAGSGGEVQAVLGAKTAPNPTAVVASNPALPFTGADLALVSVAGMTLVGMGFGLRRIAQRDGV